MSEHLPSTICFLHKMLLTSPMTLVRVALRARREAKGVTNPRTPSQDSKRFSVGPKRYDHLVIHSNDSLRQFCWREKILFSLWFCKIDSTKLKLVTAGWWDRMQPVVCTLREGSLLCCSSCHKKKHLFAIAVQCRHFLYLSPSAFALGLVCGLSSAPCLPFPHPWHNCEHRVCRAESRRANVLLGGLPIFHFLSQCVTLTTAHIKFARCSTLFVLFLVCPIWCLFDIHTLKDVTMPMVTFFATNSFDILPLDSSRLLKLCTTLATGTSPNLKRFLRPRCLAPKLLL